MNLRNKFFLPAYKEDAMTFLVALLCLVLLAFFPTNGASQKITSGVIFLAILPLLYLKLILKKNLSDFGWQAGDWKNGLLFSLIYLAGGLVLFYAFIHFTSFSHSYKLPVSVMQSFWYFIFYELVIIGLFIALYEIFFRGFLMFSLAQKTGIYAVFYQFLAFFLFFWITGNLTWNNSPFFIATAFSGLVTFKSRSLLYSLVASLLFFLLFDALAIRLIR